MLEGNGAYLVRSATGGYTVRTATAAASVNALTCLAVYQNSMRVPGLLQAIRVGRAVLTLSLSVLVWACDTSGVAWTDPMTLPSTRDGGRLVVDTKGRARLVSDTSLSITPSGDARLCVGSVRAVRQDDGTLVAVWWSARNDSSAVLLSAVSADGGASWRAATRIDTADVSVVGCDRPPPSLAASAGFVHVVYSMRGREGAGIFYAHSMNRGQHFELPLTIVYGDHLTHTAAAADRGVVAVAYEDPNGAAQQIGLAISRDWGHIFGDRARGSTGLGAATSPEVAVAGREIAVGWMQGTSGGEEDDSNARTTRVVRVGRLQ